MRELVAVGVVHAMLALGVADAVFAQGSTGGTLGKTDQELSGSRSKEAPPEKDNRSRKSGGVASEGAADPVAGQWIWQADCSQTGNWQGGFVIRQGGGGTVVGEFNQGHPGSFSGRVTGSKISFTRTFTTVVTISQVWTAHLSKGAMQGSFGDPFNGRCTFRATRA
jgi:hypothetical protein